MKTFSPMPMDDACPDASRSGADHSGAGRMTVTLLGTGTSTGVPVIGCGCRVCRSQDPRDDRTRCACLVELDGGLTLLIDAGPDFRRQALRQGIGRIDAVLFTHAHFDHIVGLDDLRPFFFTNEAPIPCFTGADTASILRRMFPYIFVDDSYKSAPKLVLREVEAPFCTRSRYGTGATARVEPIRVFHGEMPIYGYRIGRFAYLTDTSRIPDEGFAQLEDLDVLVLDALRPEPHPTHFSIGEAVEVAQRIGARQTYFTHLTHNVLHAEAEAGLPENIGVGHDALSFRVDGGRHSG